MSINKEMICLLPTCEREVYSRGLCISHYNTVCRLISEGRSTWLELEKLGKALPKKSKQGSRDGSVDWFLNESREEDISEG